MGVLRTVDTWSGDPGFAVVAWGDALGIEREGWGWGKPSGTPNTLNMVNEHIYLFIRDRKRGLGLGQAKRHTEHLEHGERTHIFVHSRSEERVGVGASQAAHRTP